MKVCVWGNSCGHELCHGGGLVVVLLVMTLMLRIMVPVLSVAECVLDDGGNIDGKSDVLVVLAMVLVMNCVIDVMMVVMEVGVV